MAEIKLGDLLDEPELVKAIEDGFVRRQVHPSQPLAILNYTERATYERAWNDVTRQCRGLIYDTRTGVVVARPFPKFFNYGEHPDDVFGLGERVAVTDKMDGSLGIAYRGTDGRLAIATRGSFASDQALHATARFRDRYEEAFAPFADDSLTYLFEVVYPANRIVVDYGTVDDLYYLGCVDTATGRSHGPDVAVYWPGPRTPIFACSTLAEALEMEPRGNAEGIVVHFLRTDVRVKVKQADYLALHRILTQTSARTVWEFLAVAACKDLIHKPLHWGTYLEMDYRRVEEVLAVGDDWLATLTAQVPDEFHDWLRRTIDGINRKVDDTRAEILATAEDLMRKAGGDRKAYAGYVKGHPHSGALFHVLDGYDLTRYLWLHAFPPPEKAWGARSEDVA